MVKTYLQRDTDATPQQSLVDAPATAFFAQDTDPGVGSGGGSVWKNTSVDEWWTRNGLDTGWYAEFSPSVAAVGDDDALANTTATTGGDGSAQANTLAHATGAGDASARLDADALSGVSDAGVQAITREGGGGATVARWALAVDGNATGTTNASASGIGNASAASVATVTTGTATNGFRSTSAAGTIGLTSTADETTLLLVATGLPTADPVVAGAFWVDTGTLKVSAG